MSSEILVEMPTEVYIGFFKGCQKTWNNMEFDNLQGRHTLSELREFRETQEFLNYRNSQGNSGNSYLIKVCIIKA